MRLAGSGLVQRGLADISSFRFFNPAKAKIVAHGNLPLPMSLQNSSRTCFQKA
jgi:hypothetical protein